MTCGFRSVAVCNEAVSRFNPTYLLVTATGAACGCGAHAGFIGEGPESVVDATSGASGGARPGSEASVDAAPDSLVSQADGADASVPPDGPPFSTGCGTKIDRVWTGLVGPTWSPKDWDPRSDFSPTKENRVEVIADRRFGNALRVQYSKGTVDNGGTEFRARVPGLPTDTVCLSFFLRFAPAEAPGGFQWVKGGVLPGLCGGDCSSGSNAAGVGDTGWSLRFSWRAGGDGKEDGYLGSPASTNGFGAEIGPGAWNFHTGTVWHHLEEEVTLNTPQQPDGIVRVWYDTDAQTTAPTFEISNIVYRNVGTLLIDQLFFSTFFGGHTADWATPESTYADFAAFEIFK